MPKFRKKPVVIEAIQYTGKNGLALSSWSNGIVFESPVLEKTGDNLTGEYLQIKTLEGIMTALVGDWIIKGVKGEFYPCKPDIFEQTYTKDVSIIQVENLSFGQAYDQFARKGYKIARKGWNGKGMFVYEVSATKYPANRNENKQVLGLFEDDLVPYRSYLAMKTAQNNVVPWLASQSDISEKDWMVLDYK